MTKKVNVTFNGKVIGTAEVDDGNAVMEIEVDENDMKHIIPGGDVTEGLSIAFAETGLEPVPMDAYTEAYFQQNPDAPRDYSEAYYANRPKGTFDA